MHAADLWTRMTDSWGYFTGEGYGGHLFPVIIGETGTNYQTVSPVSREYTAVCSSHSSSCYFAPSALDTSTFSYR